MAELNLKGRSICSLGELTEEELTALTERVAKLYDKKQRGVFGTTLARKSIALIMDQADLGSYGAYTVAIHDEGGFATRFNPAAVAEEPEKSAQYLGGLFDMIVYRGEETILRTFAEKAGVPVISGGTEGNDPARQLAIRFLQSGQSKEGQSEASMLLASAKALLTSVGGDEQLMPEEITRGPRPIGGPVREIQ